ncbi:trypsin-like serine peptidase [Pyxidicoccus trucidator]|uniref:trypsin-like serine peptidase n=1 Tax=Pyxidicoccus trucidator TaxID=2709662 RepID=UPI0013D9CD37|nr:trypsin-like serine protease [Pyxidicoccus trucidator]
MSPTRTHVRGTLLGVLLCTLSFAACGPAPEAGPSSGTPPTGTERQPVVYGTDNRTDVYAHADTTLRARAQQSTVALMRPSALTTSGGVVTFNASTLRSAYSLCSSERFLDDPTPAFCSGTLIDDNLVLTAGHCITSASDCNNTRFVFNFYRTSASALQAVSSQDVFSCQSIVVRQQSTTNGRNLDYAIVRMDRAATPRFTPAPVRTATTALAVGANVTVIGSGSGIPFKIDSGGSVRDARASTLDYFVASTDTFGGNSGSGVYEMGGYTVAGILVRGETDYRSSGSCYIVNVCTEAGCRGEDITYVRPALEAFCTASTSTRLCSSEPPPPATNFTYTASNTSNATTNTTNKVVALTAGQKITLGTCGLAGAVVTGDTYLRLFGPAGTLVGSNDDACGGRGSNLSFTATTAGNYEIRAGCYGSGSCGGTVVWTLEAGPPPATSGSFSYSASNTNSAQQNTTPHDLSLTAGQTLSFGTCTVAGASGTGDTYLRLYNAAGQQVGGNDDSCGQLSHATYVVPAGAGGTYQVRAGCYGSGSCGGTVAWTVQ